MTRYEIQVAGHVDQRRARALGAESCRHLQEGRSALLVTAVDAAATYGLIARLRDAGLELVSFTPTPQDLGDGRPEEHDASL